MTTLLACLATLVTLSAALAQAPPIPAYRDLTPRTLLRAPCPAGEVERLAWHAAGPDGQPLAGYAISTWRWRQQDVMIAEYPPPDSRRGDALVDRLGRRWPRRGGLRQR